MAFKETQSAIVIDTLIADLVQEAIDQRQSIKEHNDPGPCQRLYDILGIMPCSPNDEEIDIDSVSHDKGWINRKSAFNPICSCPAQRDLQSDNLMKERRELWHSWLVPALADGKFLIYSKER